MTNPLTATIGAIIPNKLAENISENKNFLLLVSVIGLGIFAMYAYKTFLETKLVKQELALNEYALANQK